MFATNAYPVRFATDADADTLKRLAERDSQQPLGGRVLIGEIDGTPAAALSLRDGRVTADPSRRTGRLVVYLRMRADGIRAFEATPSLPDRLRAAFAAYRSRTSMAPTVLPGTEHAERQPDAEREPVRVAA
jgi:hypothetical protein